jgi:hypothetical protein
MKEHGGTALVLHPNDALVPFMPRAAIAAGHPDACSPANKDRSVRGLILLPLPNLFAWLSPRVGRSGASRMTTDTERVIETLRRSPRLDDDELARQAGVNPRLVSQICRYLEILRRVHRAPGPDGKIINTLIDI